MNPLIISEHLLIRPLSEAELATFAKYRAHSEVAKFQSWSGYTLEQAITLHTEMNKFPFGTEECWFQLAIITKDNAQLVGDLAVHFIDKDQVEVGFTIAPQFQKKKIGFEALTALINYLFETTHKHRIIAVIDTRNMAACNLLKKSGFRKEAHFKENIYFKGEWASEFLFAILRSEWNNKPAC